MPQSGTNKIKLQSIGHFNNTTDCDWYKRLRLAID